MSHSLKRSTSKLRLQAAGSKPVNPQPALDKKAFASKIGLQPVSIDDPNSIDPPKHK